jgi:pimeloyl-ACP methyl ester carboxylesterase
VGGGTGHGLTGHPTQLHVVELEAHRDLPAEERPQESLELPVVLVHGSLDRSTSFLRTARRLEDLTVVLYDRRGYSKSRALTPVATDIDTHVDDLLEVIDGSHVALVGHSLGGLVALCAAERDPEVIRSVGAYEPPLPWFDWWPHRARSTIATQDPSEFAESFFDRVAGAGSWARLNDAGRQARRADGPALVAELAAIRADHALVDLPNLAVPTIAGRGSESLVHHRHAAEVVAELVPGAKLIEIEGARHGAHLSHPDAFAHFVREVHSIAR